MSTNNRRERKKKDRDRAKEQARREQKDRLERVLSALGLLDGFHQLPGAIRAAITRALPGRPVVAVPPELHRDPELVGLKDAIEKTLREPVFSIHDGRTFPAADLMSVCPALPDIFASLPPRDLSSSQRDFA